MSKPLDIINLPYPMFPVTEEEKKLLRLAEIRLQELDSMGSWEGVCILLRNCEGIQDIKYNLINKIENSFRDYPVARYLHEFVECKASVPDIYYYTNKYNNLIRRVWITKLLNQDVLEQK